MARGQTHRLQLHADSPFTSCCDGLWRESKEYRDQASEPEGEMSGANATDYDAASVPRDLIAGAVMSRKQDRWRVP